MTQSSYAFTTLVKSRDVTDTIIADSWNYRFYDAIKWGYEENIFSWFKDWVNQWKFLPNANVTRTEFLAMLFKTTWDVINSNSNTKCFSDSNTSTWWNPYICTSKSKKYISWYSDGSFKPNNPITVNEAYVILVNAFWISSWTNISESVIWQTDSPSNYSIDINNWIIPYLTKAQNMGIRFDTYYPTSHCEKGFLSSYHWDGSECNLGDMMNKPITRGQTINLLYQAYSLIASKNKTQEYYDALKNKDGVAMFNVLSGAGKQFEGTASRLDWILKSLPIKIESITYKWWYFAWMNKIIDANKNSYLRNAVQNIFTVSFRLGASSTGKIYTRDITTTAVFEDSEWKILNDTDHFSKVAIDERIYDKATYPQCYSPSLNIYNFLWMFLEVNSWDKPCWNYSTYGINLSSITNDESWRYSQIWKESDGAMTYFLYQPKKDDTTFGLSTSNNGSDPYFSIWMQLGNWMFVWNLINWNVQ